MRAMPSLVLPDSVDAVIALLQKAGQPTGSAPGPEAPRDADSMARARVQRARRDAPLDGVGHDGQQRQPARIRGRGEFHQPR